MTTATKTEFFDVLGPLDVNPRVDQSSLKTRFHVCRWETCQYALIGTSVTDSWSIKPTIYSLENKHQRTTA